MAGVQTRKEEEKKRESHKQTIHKVPPSDDLTLLHLSAWKRNLKLMNTKACNPDSVCPPDSRQLFHDEVVARRKPENTKKHCQYEQVGSIRSSSDVIFKDALHRCRCVVKLPSRLVATCASAVCKSSLSTVKGIFMRVSACGCCECTPRSSSCGDSGCFCADWIFLPVT